MIEVFCNELPEEFTIKINNSAGGNICTIPDATLEDIYINGSIVSIYYNTDELLNLDFNCNILKETNVETEWYFIYSGYSICIVY